MNSPLRCGCGGEPEYSTMRYVYGGEHDSTTHYINCRKCGITISGDDFEDVHEKWNTAMSGNRVRIHSVLLADDEKAIPWQDDKNPKRWRCSCCGAFVCKVWNFCQHCGSPLDWKGA